jgi:hypothetical protein
LLKKWILAAMSAPQESEPDPTRVGEPYRVEGRPARFFISYRRRADEDARLATFLRERLQAVGHEVFIDVGMPVGTDWSAEITQRIDWCDFLVVVLSENSINSEMVQAEVRLAHHCRAEGGRPGILPIRIRFEGRLRDYELSAYIGRLNYVMWRSLDDDVKVLDAVLQAASSGVERAPRMAGGQIEATPQVAKPRPVPSVDLRMVSGTTSPDDAFYVERRGDTTIKNLWRRNGETLVIKAPRQFGKSSLLVRYLHGCKDQKKRCAVFDLQGLAQKQLADYPIFLAGFAKKLLQRVNLPEADLPILESGDDLTDLVERRILDRLEEPLVLAFDEADRILGRTWQGDFFGMLRVWHNNRATIDAWRNVDLALVVSTEPYLLIESDSQSPFNVGEIIALKAFEVDDVAELCEKYDVLLNAAEIDELHQLLGGQPYLTRLALYRLRTEDELTLRKLANEAADDDGYFIEHLKALLLKVQAAKLQEVLRETIRTGEVPGRDMAAYYRLNGAGILTKDGDRVVPANLLYARFFKRML